MITLDTYRIAAVEQLKTYANILDIPMRVAYSKEDLAALKSEFVDYDIVLVDTAGRSHKNEVHVDELKDMLNLTKDDLREVYLVMSATTKYKDLVQIVECYRKITGFNVIFTKTDETSSIGNIFHVFS